MIKGVTRGDLKNVRGCLMDRASYDEYLAKCTFCSDEPLVTEVVVVDADRQFYFMMETVLFDTLNPEYDSGNSFYTVARNLLYSLDIAYQPVDPEILVVGGKTEAELDVLRNKMFPPSTFGLSETRLPKKLVQLVGPPRRLPSCCFPNLYASGLHVIVQRN